MTRNETNQIERLREVFDLHLDVGLHHGAQLAVYRDGTPVVDLAGGVTEEDGEAVTPDRPFPLFSCTKPYTGACIHHLVDAGVVSYDDSVQSYWPEFADPESEKARVTIGQVLSHQAGLPSADVDSDPDRWSDWAAIVESVEATDLVFEPGSTAGYHALTYGWILGEVVRRASGQRIGEYVWEHVFDPLDMNDTYLGLPAGEGMTVATAAGFDEFDRCRTPDVGFGGMSPREGAALFNREAIQRAVVPSAGAVGTARDMVRFYACIANGGELDGTRLLSETTLNRALETHVSVERDQTLGIPRRYTLGFQQGGTIWDRFGNLTPESVVGHGGFGCAVGWADTDSDLAMAYVSNGIRGEYESWARLNVMADAVRTAFER